MLRFLTAAMVAAVFLGGTTPAPAAIVPCVMPSKLQFVPIASTLGGIVFDQTCEHVYVSNTTLNRIEDFSLRTGTLNAPILVATSPQGLDLTPDGTYLYVANSGSHNLSVVDLDQRVELRRIFVPPLAPFNDSPNAIAIANNGLALFATTRRLMELNLATDVVRLRTDFGNTGLTSEKTRLSASGDRSVIGIVSGGIHPAPVFRYSAASDAMAARSFLTSAQDISVSRDGATFLLASSDGYAIDANLNLSGTLVGPAPYGGSVNSLGTTAYRASGAKIDVFSLTTFLKTSQLPLGDTVTSATVANLIGHSDISPDSRFLAVITDHGIAVVPTNEFMDDPLVPGTTPIKALHITELRDRIDSIRQARGLAPFSWADPALIAGMPIRGQHVADLREALTQAYIAAGVTPPTFTDTIVGTMPIKAIHIMELRSAVTALQ